MENRPDKLAEAIRNLLGSRERRTVLEKRAEAYASAHSYGRIAEETIAVYRKVLGRLRT